MKRIFWIKLSTKLYKKKDSVRGSFRFAVSVYELDPAKLLTFKLSGEPINNNSDIYLRLVARSKYFKQEFNSNIGKAADNFEKQLLQEYPDCRIFRKEISAYKIIEELFK